MIIILLLSSQSYGQYYLRGQVKNVLGNLLQDVRILVFSKGSLPFNTGNEGSFGIPSSLVIDTMYLELEGYENLKLPVKTSHFQNIVLKMLPETINSLKSKLNSRTKDLNITDLNISLSNGESYSNLIENNFIEASKFSETGFTLNIDRASYSNIRRFINNDLKVPTEAVRIEEMLNYFDFNILTPTRNKFEIFTQYTTCPWNKETQLFFINTQAPKLDLKEVPPCNLVFLIDVSGSMDKPNRLPLLQSAFKLLIDNLREQDSVAIVTYGGGVTIELPSTNGKNKTLIKNVIDSLLPAGVTPGEGALRTAYNEANRAFIKKGNNRIILATDGDFNVGQTSEKELEELVTLHKKTGIYLTCLGVGMGNYKDSKLEALAKKGDGNFAYLDNIHEAEKVLVKEFTKTVYAVAKDAFINVNFNNKVVQEYRLLGYANKQNVLADSSNILEGGEVGSGHSSMAIFEIKTIPSAQINNVSLATIQLNYKQINSEVEQMNYKEIPFTSPILIDSAINKIKLAASIAFFGDILKHSKYTIKNNFNNVLRLAEVAIDQSNFSEKEFLQLIVKANTIYFPKTMKQRGKKRNGK